MSASAWVGSPSGVSSVRGAKPCSRSSPTSSYAIARCALRSPAMPYWRRMVGSVWSSAPSSIISRPRRSIASSVRSATTVWCTVARVDEPLRRGGGQPPHGAKSPLRTTQAWVVANCTTALRICSYLGMGLFIRGLHAGPWHIGIPLADPTRCHSLAAAQSTARGVAHPPRP